MSNLIDLNHSCLFTLNNSNNFTQTITLSVPTTEYKFFNIISNNSFLVDTNLGTVSFFVDLYGPNIATASGLNVKRSSTILAGNSKFRYKVSAGCISEVVIKLSAQESRVNTQLYTGAIVFYRE